MSSLAFYTSLEDSAEVIILCDDCGDCRNDLTKDDSQPQFDSNARCDSCEITQAQITEETVKEFPEKLQPIRLPRARNI